MKFIFQKLNFIYEINVNLFTLNLIKKLTLYFIKRKINKKENKTK